MRWACVWVDGVEAAREDAHVRAIASALTRHTPNVEPCVTRPGRLWVDPRGFDHEGDLGPWARAIIDDLDSHGWSARLGAGWTRAGSATFAATARPQSFRQAASRAVERDAIAAAPPHALCDDADTLDALAELGLDRIGDLVTLDRAGLRERLGVHAEALARAASLDPREAPLSPVRPKPKTRHATQLGWASARVEPIARAVADALPGMLDALARRHEVAQRVIVHALDEHDAPAATYALVPARGELSARAFLELLALKMERDPPTRPVQEVRVEAVGRPAEADASDLGVDGGRARDLDAGARAIGRVRAALGDDAVTSVEVVRAHLPAQRERRARAKATRRARPSARLGAVIVRTRRDDPLTSGSPPRGALVAHGVRVSTGWWDSPTERTYAVFERGGRARWAYHDAILGVWVCEGEC